MWTAVFVKTCDGIGASGRKVRREVRAWSGVDGGAHEVGGNRKKKKKKIEHAQKCDRLVVLCMHSRRMGRQFAGVA